MPSTSPPKENDKGTYALISLGCPKNLVDSERMAGLLKLDGYRLVDEPASEISRVDFVVINTCGFIDSARAESFDVIGEMVRLKEKGAIRGLIVAGCLAQRNREQLLDDYPEIDQLVGVFGRDEIATAADRILGGLSDQRTIFRPAPSRPLSDGQRLRITPRHLAFLKIAEGCNRQCSFCAIPQLRGPYASKPIDEIVTEAEELAADGVKELVLVAQDTSFYGKDTHGEPRLAELLGRLDRVEGLAWIRLMYLYPLHITDELIDRLASAERILPYLDIPLQHINDDVLRRMRRRVTRAQTEQLIEKLRRRIDRLVIRTTLIAGFPGETESQFEELHEFVRWGQFERLGAFAFCKEPGTPAADLDGHLPEEVKQDRRDRLLATQQEIAFAWNESQVGRRMDVIIDRYIPEQENAYVGRGFADAPEVDGVVYVTGESLDVGEIVSCEIVATADYDLIGVALGDETDDPSGPTRRTKNRRAKKRRRR